MSYLKRFSLTYLSHLGERQIILVLPANFPKVELDNLWKNLLSPRVIRALNCVADNN